VAKTAATRNEPGAHGWPANHCRETGAANRQPKWKRQREALPLIDT